MTSAPPRAPSARSRPRGEEPTGGSSGDGAPPRHTLRPVAEVVWSPTPEVLERANVVRFMRRHGFDDYRAFQQRSQDDPDWFWPAAIDDMGLEFAAPWERVSDLSRGPEWATWFVGRQAQHRVELRAPLGRATPGRRRRGLRRARTATGGS